jgi:hypothetical protein
LTQHATDNQLGKIQERKNTLQRKLDNWAAIQDLYVPNLALLRRTSYGHHEDQPQTATLWLPSVILGRIACDCRLYVFEWELRVAQAKDSLHDIRTNLQLRSHLYKHKDRFIIGQQANTRANVTISRVQQQINASATRYRISRRALQSLAPHLAMDDSWKVLLPELRDEDIRSMTIGEEGETEGRRTISWIWRRGEELAIDADDTGSLHECMYSFFHSFCPLAYKTKALRVEWCKARARALRWTEEVCLLLEEMRRVLQFLEWKASVWEARATTFGDDGDAEHNTIELVGSRLLLHNRQEGLRAYALYQAWIQRELCRKFRSLWKDVPSRVISSVSPDIDTTFDVNNRLTQELASTLTIFLQR